MATSQFRLRRLILILASGTAWVVSLAAGGIFVAPWSDAFGVPVVGLVILTVVLAIIGYLGPKFLGLSHEGPRREGVAADDNADVFRRRQIGRWWRVTTAALGVVIASTVYVLTESWGRWLVIGLVGVLVAAASLMAAAWGRSEQAGTDAGRPSEAQPVQVSNVDARQVRWLHGVVVVGAIAVTFPFLMTMALAARGTHPSALPTVALAVFPMFVHMVVVWYAKERAPGLLGARQWRDLRQPGAIATVERRGDSGYHSRRADGEDLVELLQSFVVLAAFQAIWTASAMVADSELDTAKVIAAQAAIVLMIVILVGRAYMSCVSGLGESRFVGGSN